MIPPTTWDRALWRLAVRLQQQYSARRRTRRQVELPEATWIELLRTRDRLQLAHLHDWKAAAGRVHEDLSRELERLAWRLEDLKRSISIDVCPSAPSLRTLRTLYEELLAVRQEFGGLAIDEEEIVVTTEPIELDGIYLGPFQIRLPIQRSESEPFRVVAVDPQPAASSSETTHPHVNNEQLCVGEGRAAIDAAVREGRLFDFFAIVDRILHTYASGSAYVELARWLGTSCRDCDDSLSDDETYRCGQCEAELCSDCLNCCHGCDAGLCGECRGSCDHCDETTCGSCLGSCTRCRHSVCFTCLDENLCPTCLEEVNAEPTEEEPLSTEPQSEIQSVCLGEVPVPARSGPD